MRRGRAGGNYTGSQSYCNINTAAALQAWGSGIKKYPPSRVLSYLGLRGDVPCHDLSWNFQNCSAVVSTVAKDHSAMLSTPRCSVLQSMQRCVSLLAKHACKHCSPMLFNSLQVAAIAHGHRFDCILPFWSILRVSESLQRGSWFRICLFNVCQLPWIWLAATNTATKHWLV